MNLSKEKDRLKQYILWEKCLWVSEEALLCMCYPGCTIQSSYWNNPDYFDIGILLENEL